MSTLLGLPTEPDLFEADLDEPGLSDEELTALALAADPDAPLDPDATPWAIYSPLGIQLLPLWYMPPVTAGCNKRWRRPVVAMIVSAFLLIDAFGLCITYGHLVAA